MVLKKYCSHAIHRPVLSLTGLFPLLPCSTCTQPSLSWLISLLNELFGKFWTSNHASRQTGFPLMMNWTSYSPESFSSLCWCRKSSKKFLLSVWDFSFSVTSILLMSPIETCLRHLSSQQRIFSTHNSSSSLLIVISSGRNNDTYIYKSNNFF